MSEQEYNRIVYDAYKHKEDFWIVCGLKDHKQHILNMMDSPRLLAVDGVEYYIGEKYQVLMYNLKRKRGKANFNSKNTWKGIKNIMERNR